MATTADSGLDIASKDLDISKPLQIIENNESLRRSEFIDEYLTRLKNGRDMHTTITAASETGVGKTTCAASLALLLDFSGWTIEKATLDPAEYAYLYDKKNYCAEHAEQDTVPLSAFERCSECVYDLAAGSWLIGDEWEQAVDARDSMTKENKEASHSVATKRYRQIMGVYTLPSKSWMDNRFSDDAVDYWLQAKQGPSGQPKGEADVYRVKINEHRNAAYTDYVETISWPILDWHPEFKKLERMKKQRMEGEIKRTYIHRDEFEEAKKNFWKKATQKSRFHAVKAMAKDGLGQQRIADIMTKAEHLEGLSQSGVSRLVNAESFEDFYST